MFKFFTARELGAVTRAGDRGGGDRKPEQDLPGYGVYGEGVAAGVPPLPGPTVRHKEGSDRVCV